MLSKDVTAKCYGGDITRKQKKGNAPIREYENAFIPQEALIAVLQIRWSD